MYITSSAVVPGKNHALSERGCHTGIAYKKTSCWCHLELYYDLGRMLFSSLILYKEGENYEDLDEEQKGQNEVNAPSFKGNVFKCIHPVI